jgi:hypothetical protein
VNVRKILYWSFVFFFCGLSFAKAAPERGDFNWKNLFGDYVFTSCKNDGRPIWGQDPQAFHLVVSDDPFETHESQPNYLGIVRYRFEDSPLLVNWDIDRINLGRFETKDEASGKVVRISENYVTEDGLFGFLQWNYSAVESGWASIQLHMNDKGEVYYEMREQRVDDSRVQSETCRLTRRSARSSRSLVD